MPLDIPVLGSCYLCERCATAYGDYFRRNIFEYLRKRTIHELGHVTRNVPTTSLLHWYASAYFSMEEFGKDQTNVKA